MGGLAGGTTTAAAAAAPSTAADGSTAAAAAAGAAAEALPSCLLLLLLLAFCFFLLLACCCCLLLRWVRFFCIVCRVVLSLASLPVAPVDVVGRWGGVGDWSGRCLGSLSLSPARARSHYRQRGGRTLFGPLAVPGVDLGGAVAPHSDAVLSLASSSAFSWLSLAVSPLLVVLGLAIVVSFVLFLFSLSLSLSLYERRQQHKEELAEGLERESAKISYPTA